MVADGMARVANRDQEEGMIFPGVKPFASSTFSVVLSVVYLKVGLISTDPASVLVPIKDLKSEAFPSWIFQAALVHGFLIFDLLCHGFFWFCPYLILGISHLYLRKSLVFGSCLNPKSEE